jgi:peptidylprolyl isomerase
MVQGGDPLENGLGGPGYTIEDEFVSWLDFYQTGMLAMANAGPDTGGSQFFMTMYAADWLNHKHTVFGEVVSDADLTVIRKLEVGDRIKEIRFEGDIDFFLALEKDRVDEWNEILDREHPGLKEYPVKDITDPSFDETYTNYKSELERIQKEKIKIEKPYDPKFIPAWIRYVDNKYTAAKERKGEVSDTERLADHEPIKNFESISVGVTSDGTTTEEVTTTGDTVLDQKTTTTTTDEDGNKTTTVDDGISTKEVDPNDGSDTTIDESDNKNK